MRLNSSKNLVYRYASRWISIVLCETPIQFRLLLSGQRKDIRSSVRFFRDAVPDVTDKLKAVRHAQAAIVERWIPHA